MTITANTQRTNAEQFRSLVIANPNGAPIHLGDVADVQDSVENQYTGSWYDGQRGIILAIQRQPDANTVDVIDAINAKLPQLHAEIPPSVNTVVMVIGSAPGAEDDREGVPFSGKSGQLFDKMLAAIGLRRSAILLTQVIPWRPPGNRAPSAAEMDICRPFIERQIALAEPKAILLLGNFSARFFFGENDTIHGLRGRWKEIAAADCVIPAIASLHPQDLLTAPVNKRLAWNDLLAFQAKLKSLSLLRN